MPLYIVRKSGSTFFVWVKSRCHSSTVVLLVNVLQQHLWPRVKIYTLLRFDWKYHLYLFVGAPPTLNDTLQNKGPLHLLKVVVVVWSNSSSSWMDSPMLSNIRRNFISLKHENRFIFHFSALEFLPSCKLIAWVIPLCKFWMLNFCEIVNQITSWHTLPLSL